MSNRPDTPLLDQVRLPADMSGLSDRQLGQLADELRAETIAAVSQTGGHLGAGLGVVELTVALWLDAGGARALADDRATITAVVEAPGLVVVAVKAWEPPVAELLDFLRALRDEVGDGRSVHVVPVGLDAQGAPDRPVPRHVDVWRRALAGLGDPWLRLVDPRGDAS